MSEVRIFFRSMSNFVVVLILPAVAKAGCKPSAQMSCMRL